MPYPCSCSSSQVHSERDIQGGGHRRADSSPLPLTSLTPPSLVGRAAGTSLSSFVTGRHPLGLSNRCVCVQVVRVPVLYAEGGTIYKSPHR